MNTKVLLALACVVVTTAHAAPYDTTLDVTRVSSATEMHTAVDDNDNRGMALLLDEKSQPGRVVVTGVSRLAKAGGVRPGDIIQSLCTQPASAQHVAKIQALLDGAETMMTIGNHLLVGSLPKAAAKDDGRYVVTARALQLKADNNLLVTVGPGERIQEICVPVRNADELITVEAPYEWRPIDGGGKVQGGWLPMEYVFERPGQAARLFLRLTSMNPPMSVQH